MNRSFIVFVFLFLYAGQSYSQVLDRYFRVNGVRYELNSTYNYSCGETLLIQIANQYRNQVIAVPTTVQSFTHSNHVTASQLGNFAVSAITQAPTGTGFITITAKYLYETEPIQESAPFSETLYLSHDPGSPVFTVSPNVCNGGSAQTFTVDPREPNYSNIEWQGNGALINGNSTYISNSSSASVSLTNDVGYLKVRVADNCGVFGSWSDELKLGKPTVSYPNQWLFDPGSNMWQLSHTSQPGFSSSYTVYSGSASLIPNGNDCYVTTSDGAVIQLIVSSACGSSSSPYHFFIPAQGGMMLAYPNPVKENITLQFKNIELQEQLPESVKLYSEKSGEAVKFISVTDYFNRKAFKDGNKIELNVTDLPRGTYYLHVYPNAKHGSEPQKMRMVLE